MDPDFARQYYESAAADHWWFRGRRALVAGLLHRWDISSGVFADLGAGSASLLPESFDIVKLDLVRPESALGKFVQGSADQLPFRSGVLDGIGLFDVLEHLDDPAECLGECTRVIRPNGVVLVTVPAFQRLWSPHDDIVGHKRRYTRGGLVAELETAGLTVEWSSAFFGFLLLPAMVRAALSLRSPMKHPGSGMNRALTTLAERSAASVLRRPTTLGLSLAAVALRR